MKYAKEAARDASPLQTALYAEGGEERIVKYDTSPFGKRRVGTSYSGMQATFVHLHTLVEDTVRTRTVSIQQILLFWCPEYKDMYVCLTILTSSVACRLSLGKRE